MGLGSSLSSAHSKKCLIYGMPSGATRAPDRIAGAKGYSHSPMPAYSPLQFWTVACVLQSWYARPIPVVEDISFQIKF